MSKQQLFDWFYTNSTNLTADRILIIMLSGFCISAVIYATYWITYRGVAYNAKFNMVNVVITQISIIVMLMISSNIVISLGMVGALSIIRFRTAIKDPKDTTFIFWSLTEGLCVGSQNFKLAIISATVIAAILLIFHFVTVSKRKYLVIIRGEERPINVEIAMNVIKRFGLSFNVRSSTHTHTRQEMIIEIKAKNLGQSFTDELLKVDGISAVNWLIENGDTIG